MTYTTFDLRFVAALRYRVAKLLLELLLELLLQISGADILANLEAYRLSLFFVSIYLMHVATGVTNEH